MNNTVASFDDIEVRRPALAADYLAEPRVSLRHRYRIC